MAKIENNGFKISKDVTGFPTYLPTNFCYGPDILMEANTEYVIQVPPAINLAIFQKTAGTNLFIVQDDNSIADSIHVPTSGGWTWSEQELNTPGLGVIAGKYLHFLSTEDNFLKVKLYNTGTSQR